MAMKFRLFTAVASFSFSAATADRPPHFIFCLVDGANFPRQHRATVRRPLVHLPSCAGARSVQAQRLPLPTTGDLLE